MYKKNNIRKITLPEENIPRFWYNIVADMKNKPHPYRDPVTGELMKPEAMSAIFPKTVIEQELSEERDIEIPDKVREMYRDFRPSPLFRARGLEKALDTPARIYYKYEGGNATGSHKVNTAMAQAYYNKLDGINNIVTETGAGQWGSAMSMATNYFGMTCTVYMVKVSYEQKPYRRIIMNTFGATVHASPSNMTQAGRDMLAADPDCRGSLGLAISEAVEVAASRNDTNYALGSVLNHVSLQQTLLGLESKVALESIDEYPDIVIGCCGGGSNFSGIAFPFLKDKLTRNTNIRCIAVEPESCPTLTKGVFAYDYGDVARFTPIMEMYTLGHSFMPSGIYAGGLRFHGASPIVSRLYHDGLIEAQAYNQTSVFDAAVRFSRAEGIVPAPESAHAIRAAIEEALICKRDGVDKCILFSLSGNGYFDMAAYDRHIHENLTDVPFDGSMLETTLKNLPEIK